MILRDAIVSEQRRPLAFARAERVPAQAKDKHEPRAQEQVLGSPSDSPAAVSVLALAPLRQSTPVAPAAFVEPEISLQRVESWLAMQDVETRTACASFLAEDIADLRQSAQAEGFASGLEEARDEARQELHEHLTLLQEITAAAEAAFQREQEKFATLCVDIIGEVFTKLAGALLSTPQATTAVVVDVLKKVREGRELTVRVNARDLPLLQAQEETLRAAVPGRSIALTADSRVEVGGCIVETSLGSLDGRLEVQLRGLYETLKAAKAASAERT